MNAAVIGLLFIALAAGALIGWYWRAQHARREKAVINAGWLEQISARRIEHERLTEQNKGLMQQVSDIQATASDAKRRAQELSEALRESLSERNELQRRSSEMHSDLKATQDEHRRLHTDINLVQQKEERIARLQSEINNWQMRVAPLIEKFRARNADAGRLEAELEAARTKIAELEASRESGQTRVEPVADPNCLTDGREASNDAIEFPRDRLQSIKGIGPAIEKTLNELGIFSFDQVAAMSEYEIDKVASRLKGFRSRIYREDWIGQARELRDGKASV